MTCYQNEKIFSNRSNECKNYLSHNDSFTSNDDNAVINFYQNSTILITGGTGFIGKALIEKLLRTCTNVSRIYLIIRPKKGQSVEDRCKDLLNSSVFDRIRSEGRSEKLLSKICGLYGDIMEPDLGLTDEQIKMITENVTVVFHSAANVRFDESLETELKLNFWGTQRIVFLCRKMIKLKALVHVSTAYSNANMANVEEIVYPIPELKREMLHPDQLLPMTLLIQVGKSVQHKHPNTYTITKSMAEMIISEFAKDLPAIIVRPSIVTAAWQEPYEGWIDNFTGITGVIIGINQGMISSLFGNEEIVADLIPVDTVVNTLLASAWYISTCRSSLLVLNCTSGSINPVTWEKIALSATCYSLIMPSKNIQWYPGVKFHKSQIVHLAHELIFEFLPSLLVDVIIKLTGYKIENPKYSILTISNKFIRLKKALHFFINHQWNFTIKNIQLLQEALQHSPESESFNIDITTLDWETYMKNYISGIRKYVLRESIDSLPSARKKLKRLYWMQKIIQIISIVVIYELVKICFSLFSNLFYCY